MASAVIGASTQQQLQELLAAAAEGPLHDEQLMQAIDELHQQYPNPTP
jgi:aryl-alcohol dehydrogenase-like predicted oxidoreductase